MYTSSAIFDDPPISLSLKSDSTVVSGQNVYLIVTVKSDMLSEGDIYRIKIRDQNNKVTLAGITSEFKIIDKSYGQEKLFLNISKELLQGDKVNFSVHVVNMLGNDVPGIPFLPVTYNVNKVSESSIIKLNTEHEFFPMIFKDNPVGKPHSKYNLYLGKVTDISGMPLIHSQIMVSTVTSGQLTLPLIYITTDSDKEESVSLVDIDRVSNFDFFTVKSDERGHIKFRVYPIQNTEVRVDFMTQIFNATISSYVSSIFIFRKESDSINKLDRPFIDGIQPDGILKKTPGSEFFNATIPSYNGVSASDAIVFFTEDSEKNKIKQLFPTYTVGDNIDGRKFPIDYEQLEPNKVLGFYYMVIPKNRSPNYSQSLGIKYVNDSFHPDENKKRSYNKVSVYNSYANYNKDRLLNNSEYYWCAENDYITWSNIENYVNNGNVELYLKVIGTLDDNDKKHPRAGDYIYLNVYIESKSKNCMHTYKYQLSSIPDERKGKLCTTVIKLLHPELDDISPYSDERSAWVYFEYYTADEYTGERNYSFYWQSMIDTFTGN
ncbi:hypothetical protein [Xenorhabdus stockiae]|uniref:hypothetical protein n=1 Tax=Xenorhabdus stockiae TaxID=351614 RepID=UPI0040629852